VAYGVAVFFGPHHVPDFGEVALFIQLLVSGCGFSFFLWTLYIALEPYVRRHWPGALVSWSRLLAGGVRDPMVGRDVLAGCLVAAFGGALAGLGWFIPSWLGYAPPQPYSGPQWDFLGARAIISDLSLSLGPVLVIPLAMLFVLVLLRGLLRKEWAAAAAFVLLFTFLFAAGSQFAPVVLATSLIYWGLLVFLLIRFGLLASSVDTSKPAIGGHFKTGQRSRTRTTYTYTLPAMVGASRLF
jgi:hypothetical protein